MAERTFSPADASWEDQTSVVTVSTMNPTQREEFRQCLESAEEVACTLIYEDGSSLLRSRKHQVGDRSLCNRITFWTSRALS